jgi:steroid 5-alpha reductase family enzyme
LFAVADWVGVRRGQHVHLYTYDLFAEKIGFKLTWGCIVFYPFFYTLGLRSLLLAPGSTVTAGVAWASAGIFALGYLLSRGANNQKHAFRVDPHAPTFLFGLVPQRTVPGSRLLCSGWWAMARHVNYFGEMLMALGIALPAALATGSWLPWTYPLYYVALLVPRDLEDGRICAAKYGAHWQEYCRRVPYRIVPLVY